MNGSERMGEGFKKFQKKILLETLIKCIATGFSLSLIITSVFLLTGKLAGDLQNPFVYILIGLGSFIILTTLLFLLFKPNKLKIAKRLDRDLTLHEKVQTMVKFENEDGLIINLQREDTKMRLANISLEKLSMKIGLFFIVIPLLASAFCVTAIAIPNQETPTISTEPTDDPFELDNWSIQAIRDLIEEVEKSSLAQNVKTAYVNALNGLIDILLETEVVSEMETAVLSTINNIYLELDKINTNNELFAILSKSSESMVITLAMHINNLDSRSVSNALDSIQAMINGTDIPLNCATMYENIGKILNNSNANKEEALYCALINFCDEMRACVTSDDLHNVFSKHKEIVALEIENQKANDNMAHYIEETLREIFNLYEEIVTEPEVTEPETSVTEPITGPTEPPTDTGGQGGLGTGETLYGSDDAFFDPELGEIVYGDVIDDYFADILNKILDGSIPKEYEDYFNQYFDELYGNSKESESE